jgi:nitrogen fixation protein FixH
MTGIAKGAYEIRGWHVLAALLAFFAAIIAVNVSFAIVAVRSFPGEDVRRSYLQGLNYNDTLAERRAQAELGWRAGAELKQDADGALVEVNLASRDGAPLGELTLAGELRRPTDARFDRALAFEQIAPGRFVARLQQLPVGVWRLRARAEAGTGALDFEADLTWPTLP